METIMNHPALVRFRKYIPLVQELVGRDIKLKYRRSVLGYFWSLLNPLMMMTIMTVIFSFMFRFDIPNYPLYLICGQTLFNCFNEAANRAMMSVIDNGNLIKKVYIPKYIFPLSKVTSCFVNMLFNLVAILIVMIFTGAGFHLSFLLFPLPLICLYLFTCGIGLILSALAVQFRDVMHLYSVLMMAWMYATPIFYPISAVPGWVQMIIRCNPLYIFIDAFRQLLLYGTFPSALAWLGCILAALLSLGAGALVFRKMQRNFIFYV